MHKFNRYWLNIVLCSKIYIYTALYTVVMVMYLLCTHMKINPLKCYKCCESKNWFLVHWECLQRGPQRLTFEEMTIELSPFLLILSAKNKGCKLVFNISLSQHQLQHLTCLQELLNFSRSTQIWWGGMLHGVLTCSHFACSLKRMLVFAAHRTEY